MVVVAGKIEELIRRGLPGADVTVSDLRGDGGHYVVYVVSEAFRGMSRVDQHREVYTVLEPALGDNLQTIAIQTAVPE